MVADKGVEEGVMTLSEIPQVSVDYTLGYKFIVVEVTDRAGNKKTVVRVRNENYEYHKDILHSLKQELEQRGFTCRCLGGGDDQDKLA
jgi:hypothetical protein